MKAAYYEGDRRFRVGQGRAVPPGPGEVRLEVAYCGVCGTDVHVYHGSMDRRVKIPQVIGHEASGAVVEIGPGVDNVQVADRVAIRPLQPGEPAAMDNGCTHIGKNLKFIGIDTPGAMQSSWTVPGYAASKGAVGQLTMALANEWAAHGVNVNAIAPGYIATDNTAALRADPQRSPAILARIPAGRWGQPDDFKGAVVFLASAASDYMHGSIVLVDGGWMGR